MRPSSLSLAVPIWAAITAAFLLAHSCFAQGQLPPLGAPAPTMKSLAQIEPRIPIPASGPFPYTISAAGSYYLTGNVTVASGDAIVINANDVTLDLAGFTIASTSPTLSGKAILLLGSFRTNISIANGFIRGTSVYNFGPNNVTGGGFAEGIGGDPAVFGGAEGTAGPTAVRVASLGISGLGEGIRLNPASVSNVVTGSTVSNVQGAGIRAGAVSDSTADRTGGVAIEARSVANVAGSRYTAGSAILPAPVAPLARADLDARIAIPSGTATYTIAAPGSYVLMGNLTVASGNGITIAADDVTLDLNGYTIASTAATAAGDAISLSGQRARIAISNGHIRSGVTYSGGVFSAGPGFDSGVNWPSSQPNAIRVSGLSVTGVKSYGIDIGSDGSSLVQACTVRIAGVTGIRAGVVSDSSVTGGAGTTISAGRVANSVGSRADGNGAGIVTASPTLDTVAAALDRRIPVSTGGTVLTEGSYYLTGNLTVSSGNGLTINGPNTTLDLNGYTISSTAVGGATTGVLITSTARNVKVVNGNITGTVTVAGGVYSGNGFFWGIKNDANTSTVTVRDVHVTGVGHGILLVGPGLVEACVVRTCSNSGITADLVRGVICQDAGNGGIVGVSVIGSIARGAGSLAINGTRIVESSFGEGSSGVFSSNGVIANSVGNGVSGGNGMYGRVIVNSSGTAISNGTGLEALRVVQNSYGFTDGAGDGIRVTEGVVTNSYGESDGNTGLRAFTANGSRGVSAGLPSQAVTNKYNMP